MEVRIPEEMTAAVRPGKRVRARSRLRLHSGGRVIDLSEAWEGGFSIARSEPLPERGVVDVFDGARHLWHGLVYQTEETGTERIYAFKIARDATLEPPRDFARPKGAPKALIPRFR